MSEFRHAAALVTIFELQGVLFFYETGHPRNRTLLLSWDAGKEAGTWKQAEKKNIVWPNGKSIAVRDSRKYNFAMPFYLNRNDCGTGFCNYTNAVCCCTFITSEWLCSD